MILEKSPVNGYFCPQDPGEPGGDKRLSVSDNEARLLAEFARGKTVLEIGTGLGVSARGMAQTAKLIYTVDVDPWVRKNVELPENVHLFASLEDYGIMPGFDMGFVDGSHAFEEVKQDTERIRGLVKKGGLLVFHDARLTPVMRALVSSGLNVTTISTNAGLGVAWND